MQRGRQNSIYVEILIRAPLEELWIHTQDPSLHERWDLRFTSIEYGSKQEATGRQQFRYATRMGFGLEIAGTGESVATTELRDGSRVSSLTFHSEDPISLILEGSGYWKYLPTAEGVRFITGYDYEQRFGSVGRMIDSVAFRPLMGWATAWSFDRLRLWLERSIDPAGAFRNFVIHGLVRVILAVVFIYQGLVPKLLVHSPLELAMLRQMGIPASQTHSWLTVTALAEILLGVALIVFGRSRLLVAFVPILMLAMTTIVLVVQPGLLASAFSPLVLNLAVATLAVIDLLMDPTTIPTASRCLRQPPKQN